MIVYEAVIIVYEAFMINILIYEYGFKRKGIAQTESCRNAIDKSARSQNKVGKVIAHFFLEINHTNFLSRIVLERQICSRMCRMTNSTPTSSLIIY